MKEYRCKACKKLLGKGKFIGIIELKCKNRDCKLNLVKFKEN